MEEVKSPIESLYQSKQAVTTGEPLMSPVPATAPGFNFEQKLKSAGSQDQMHFAKEHAFGTNHRGQNFERYYSHPSFSKLGFDPYIDNETKYNENSSWTDDFWRAAKEIPGMVGRAAWDNATGFFNLTADGNTEASAAMEKSMSIANSSRGGVGGFVTNLAGNSAYTFGILGEMLLEEAALVGLDALTGGASTPLHGPMEARHAMQLGRLGRTLSNTRDIFRAINTAQDARTFWNSAKTIGKGALNVLNPMENTTKLLMQGDKLAGMTDAARAANSISEFAKMKNGVGAFYRDLRAMRSVLTESQLEGGFTETDTYDELSRNFYEKNGRLPEGKEAEMIASQAKQAGRATAFLNMPAIFLTNKIVLERAVRGIGPRAVMQELESSGFSRNIIRNKGWKELGKDPFEFAAKGMKALGTKAYWQNLPKAIAKGSLRYSAANFAEGFQESIQEALQVGVKNYYLNQMEHPDREGTKLNSALMWDSVSKGVASQFSAEGAEVFASGFLMGTMMQGPKWIANQSTRQYMKFTKPEQFKAMREQKEKAETELLNAMNDLYKDPAKYFDAISNGMVEQLDVHTLMNEVEGDQKVGRDTVDEALLKHVHTLFHSGKTDLLIKQLASLKDLTAEELKEAFGLQADDPTDLYQRIDKSIADVKEMTARFKAVNENFVNPFDPKLYKPGTPEYEQEVMGFHGWRGAQLQVVFNRRAFDQALERMDSISNTALGNAGLTDVNALDYSLIFDEENASDEMKNLIKQVAVLSQGDAAARKEAAKLKKKLVALNEFHTARDNYKKVMKELAAAQARNEKAREKGTKEEKIDENAAKLAHKALKKSYNAYLKRITKWGTFNLDENVAKSFEQYVDFLRLSEDAQVLSTVVNQFHNPESFTRLAQIHAATLGEIHKNRAKHIEKSLKKWLKKKSTNELISLLTAEGIYFEPESMLKMLEKNVIPETFYDAVGHQPIAKNSPKHKKAAEIIDKWMQAEGRVAAPVQAPVAAPVAPPVQMTAATEKALRDAYMAAIVADPEVEKDYPTFEEWLKKSTTATTLLNQLQPPVAPPVTPAPAAQPVSQQRVSSSGPTFEQVLLVRLLNSPELAARDPQARAKREQVIKDIVALFTLVQNTPTFKSATPEKQREVLIGKNGQGGELRKILVRAGVVNDEPLLAGLAAIVLTELGTAVPVVQNTPVPLPPAPPVTPTPPTPSVQTDVPQVGDIVTVISPFADDEDFPTGSKQMRVEEVKPVRDKAGNLTGGYVRAIPVDPNDKMGSLSPISLLDETDYHIGQPPVVQEEKPATVVSEKDAKIEAIQERRYKELNEKVPYYIVKGSFEGDNYTVYTAEFIRRDGTTVAYAQGNKDLIKELREDERLSHVTKEQFDNALKYEALEKEINDKYDAEIAALDSKPTPTPVPAVPVNRSVQQVINEVKENASFITLLSSTFTFEQLGEDELLAAALDDYLQYLITNKILEHTDEHFKKWATSKYVNQRTGQLYDRVTSVGSDGKGIGEEWGPSASTIGNSIDEITRDFFDGKPMVWSNYRHRIPVTAENQKNLKEGTEIVNGRGDKFIVNAFIKGKGNTPNRISAKGPSGTILMDLSLGEYFVVSPKIQSKDDQGNDTSEATFNSFIKDLQELKKFFESRNEQVMSSGIVLYNDQLKLAGTVDIMTVDNMGVVRIYDMKSMRKNQLEAQAVGTSDASYYDYRFDGKRSNREKHTDQLSLYRILLANTHGLVAQELAIIPIKVSYEPGDMSTQEAYILKNKDDGRLELIGLTAKDDVEGRVINPKVLEAAEPQIEEQPLPVEPVAEIPTSDPFMDGLAEQAREIEEAKARAPLGEKLYRRFENYGLDPKETSVKIQAEILSGELSPDDADALITWWKEAAKTQGPFAPRLNFTPAMEAFIRKAISDVRSNQPVEKKTAPVQPQTQIEEPFEGAFSGEEQEAPRDIYILIQDHARITQELAELDDLTLLDPVHAQIVSDGGITVSKKSLEGHVGKSKVTSQMNRYFKNADEDNDTLSSVAASLLNEGIGNSEREIEDAIADFILSYPAGVGSVNSKSDTTFYGDLNSRKISLRDQLKEIEKTVKQTTGVSLEAILNAEANRRSTLSPLGENSIAEQVANAGSLDELAEVKQEAMEAFSTGDAEATGGVSSIEISEMIEQKEKELTPVSEEVVTPQDQSLANKGYQAQVAADNIDELIKEADELSEDELLQKMKDEKTC